MKIHDGKNPIQYVTYEQDLDLEHGTILMDKDGEVMVKVTCDPAQTFYFVHLKYGRIFENSRKHFPAVVVPSGTTFVIEQVYQPLPRR